MARRIWSLKKPAVSLRSERIAPTGKRNNLISNGICATSKRHKWQEQIHTRCKYHCHCHCCLICWRKKILKIQKWCKKILNFSKHDSFYTLLYLPNALDYALDFFLDFCKLMTNQKIGSLGGMTRYKLRFTTVNCGIKPLDEHRYTFSDPTLV